MKLNSTQVERTLGQFEARTIPDDHPLIPQLNDLFGEHTFFLDRHGLNIVEPVEAAGAAAQSAKVVNLASWSDDNRSSLELHEPEGTDVVTKLGWRRGSRVARLRWRDLLRGPRGRPCGPPLPRAGLA